MKFYIEYGLNWLHWESLWNLNYKEVYILLISLEQINRIIAFDDKNLIIFCREKFCVFGILDGYMFKFETGVN